MRASNLTSANLGCFHEAGDESVTCADLSEADLTRAKLMGVDFRGSDMRASNLTSANLGCFHEAGDKSVTCADLSEADLTGAFLRNTVLVGADLTGVRLTGADLELADLGCFYEAGDKRVTCADLSNTDLSNALLRNTVLVGADLTGALLAGADLRQARYNSKPIHTTDAFGRTHTLKPTKWPSGFDVSATRAVCVDC